MSWEAMVFGFSVHPRARRRRSREGGGGRPGVLSVISSPFPRYSPLPIPATILFQEVLMNNGDLAALRQTLKTKLSPQSRRDLGLPDDWVDQVPTEFLRRAIETTERHKALLRALSVAAH